MSTCNTGLPRSIQWELNHLSQQLLSPSLKVLPNVSRQISVIDTYFRLTNALHTHITTLPQLLVFNYELLSLISS